MNRIWRFFSSLLLIPGLLISGCTVGPDFVRPESPKVDRYTEGEDPVATLRAGNVAQRFDSDTGLPENWWRFFNSEKLDPIVRGALENSQTLQAAFAHLRQSQESLRAGEGVFYPQVNAAFGVSREKSNPTSFGVNASPSIFNLFTLSASVSYVLDLFGGQRRAVEGLRAQTDASQYSALAAYLTLTGNVVNAVIARAAYEAEINATREIVRAQQEQLSLTEANFKSGVLPYVNVLSLKSQLAATEASLPPLLFRLNQTHHLLAVLSGKMPAEWKMPPIPLEELTLPERLPKTLPSELVRQRPDILQAEAQLHFASAQIGVATAALFPSFTLSGTLGGLNSSLGSLVSSRSSFWNFGADITAPLFRGGTLQAQRRAAVEAFQEAFSVYRQSVLTGVQQVADALHALEHDAEFVQAEGAALDSARDALQVIQANYFSGTANYLQLLVANTQYSQAKIGYLRGVAQRYQDTVALFVALGGGWWNQPDGVRKKLGRPLEPVFREEQRGSGE